MFCLIPDLAKKLREAFSSGKISPEKLSKMTSEEARGALSKIIGEEPARQVNLLFEKKSLLKDIEKAYYKASEELLGANKEAIEATKAKIKETFADKKRRLESPEEGEKFLNEITSDIYSRKYKTGVSLEQAQEITELGRDVILSKEKMKPDFTFGSQKDALDYGSAKVALDNYLGKIKNQARAESLTNPLKQKSLGGKMKATYDNARISLNFIAENARSIVSSLDNSFFGRQGLKVLLNPKYTKIWIDSFIKSFSDIGKTLKGDASVLDGVKAWAYSQKRALQGLYENKGGTKLDIGLGEEAFPTDAPGKIPALGKLFEASRVAYEAGAMRMRVEVANKMYDMAEKTGVNLEADRVEVGNINEVVNSMTGRGKMPLSQGAQAGINKVFFSIKFLKSNVDFLLAPFKYLTDVNSFARKQAAINTLMVASSIGVALAMAKALNPDSVDFDPRSSNFGKIRIGDTRLDITGGASSVATLAMRIATQSTKSSITGEVKKLGEGYGSDTGMDVLWNFTENKFSPMFQVIKNMVAQKDFLGNKPTIGGELKNLTSPMIIQTGIEAAQNEKSANLLLVLIADALGFSTNTYSQNANWEISTSAELKSFKEMVGADIFKQANKEYNSTYNTWFSAVLKNAKYQALPQEKKDVVLNNKKGQIKDQIFRKYGFKFKKAKATKINMNQFK